MAEMEITSPIILDETGKEIKNAILSVAGAISGQSKSGIVYGFHVNSNEANPSAAVTYLRDAVGMKPAHMSSNAGFDYGSWADAFFMPRPCMLLPNGLVKCYLNPNDYTKDINGNAVDISNPSDGSNVMMEWGQNGKKIWYKIQPDTNSTSYSVFIADHQEDNDYHAWSFFNKDNRMVDHFYTACYSGSLDTSGKLRSLSGKTINSGYNAQQEMAAAKANSDYWNIQTFADSLLVYFLLYLMGKSLDLQSVYGQGNTTGSQAGVQTTGTHNFRGLFYGDQSTLDRVKVFGMEDFWGTLWNRCAGLYQNGGRMYYKLTEGVADGSAIGNYPLDSVSGLLDGGPVADTDGYITKFRAANNSVIAPYEVGGSATTYYCDHYWVNTAIVAFGLLGGASDGGALCGFAVYLADGWTGAHWGIGTALSCKPLA